jgi:hypothetical protein
VSGSEIVNEWNGKQVSIKPVTRGRLFRGEVVRSDAIGVLVAVGADRVSGTATRRTPLTSIHRSAWKRNSKKFGLRFSYRRAFP